MAAPDLFERLKFHGIDDETRAALRAARPMIERTLPLLLDQFYARIKSWPDLMNRFHGAQHIAHVKEKQLQHWLTIASGEFGDRYLESVRRIWRVHAGMNVDPSWFVGAYSWLGVSLQQAALEQANGKRPLLNLGQSAGLGEGERQAIALGRATLLDLDFAMEIYMATATARRRDSLTEIADRFEHDVLIVAEALSSGAVELQAASQSMAEAARATAQVSNGVHGAASASVSDVQTAAAASEELAASVSDVAQRADRSNAIASQAQQRAEATTTTVAALTEAAQRIEDVLQLISSIADQTNLLALNATIEAARAGEAGKGFAVVAAEVKALAEQTASATGQIGTQVKSVQQVSREAAAAMRAIAGDIGEISAAVSDIAATIQQQERAVAEISQNLSSTATRSNDTAQDIAGVRDSADATGESARQSLEAALDLARQAETLRTKATSFVESVRAA